MNRSIDRSPWTWENLVVRFGPTSLEVAMEVLPVVLGDVVVLTVRLQDGQIVYWSGQQKCWTTKSEEATPFATKAAALEELAKSRGKMEAGFLKRTGTDISVFE